MARDTAGMHMTAGMMGLHAAILGHISFLSASTNCAQCSLCLLWDMQILFQGPHVKMGVYRGRPTGVSPHVTTGRADYFGPFVNRFGALLIVSVLVTHPYTTQKPSYHHDSVFSRRHGSKHTPQADISHSVFSGKQQHPVQSQAALSCSSHNHVQPGLLQALCLVKTKLRAAPLRGYFYDG